MSHHAEWTGEDDDLTLTVPLPSAFGGRLQRDSDTDVVVHPAFAADVVTEELPMQQMFEAWPALSPTPVQPYPQSFPKADPVPFSPAPIRARSHSEVSLPSPRARLDSDTSVSTWKKTIPALRRMVGLPIVPGWAPTPLPAAPAPRPNEASTSRGSWSPVVLIAGAVCLVAMVVMTIVGFGSRAAEASRAAHTRVVSATAPGGAPVVDGTVFIDGRAECESTPCELELTTGVHWITVRAPGYETPPSRSIHAGVEEAAEVSFVLTPSAAAPPAAVAAEAAPVPPSPPAVEPAPAASTEAVLPSPLRAAARPRPALSFARAAFGVARLNINAVPAANVVLDGRPVGRTPLMGLKVKPGSHTVVLIGPDGKRAVRGTTVAAGASATLSARL